MRLVATCRPGNSRKICSAPTITLAEAGQITTGSSPDSMPLQRTRLELSYTRPEHESKS